MALCCVDKTLNGWNLERVSSICRERCGGQGYLSVNKFGDYMSIAHAAVTAEGDNRVLMVKVCKDMLTNVNKKGHKLPMPTRSVEELAALSDISDITTLCDLLRFREVSLFKELVSTTKRLLKEGKSPYEVLMRETSDVMQDLAATYGERQTLEYGEECVKGLKSSENKRVLTDVLRLYALDIVERDLKHYILAGVLSSKAAKNVTKTKHALVKELAKSTKDLLDCLNVPKHALYAPIAADYVKYNAEPNYGEVIGAKM